MSIQHCLVVRPGVKQEQITRIQSHQQVCITKTRLRTHSLKHGGRLLDSVPTI